MLPQETSWSPGPYQSCTFRPSGARLLMFTLPLGLCALALANSSLELAFLGGDDATRIASVTCALLAAVLIAVAYAIWRLWTGRRIEVRADELLLHDARRDTAGHWPSVKVGTLETHLGIRLFTLTVGDTDIIVDEIRYPHLDALRQTITERLRVFSWALHQALAIARECSDREPVEV